MRRWLMLGLSVAAVVVAGGCGSGSASAPPSELQKSEETEVPTTASSTEESPPEEVGGPLSYVGTITGTDGQGTTFSDNYSLGPLLYSQEGTPPEDVLNACGLNNTTAIASSVFARGQVTVKYQEGSLPTQISTTSGLESAVKGRLYGFVAMSTNSEWHCSVEEPVPVEFQPGESHTFPIWIIAYQVLTNARPQVPAGVLNTWYFSFIGGIVSEDHGLTVRGPGAGWCEEEFTDSAEYRLFLYNRSGSC